MGGFTYPKILTLGSAFTENALKGKVIIQEKLDGSQFRFGLKMDGSLFIGSRRKDITEHANSMFKLGWDYIRSIENKLIKHFKPPVHFFSEYLKKPKHNTLKYKKVPKNHLTLFDGIVEGAFVSYKHLIQITELLEIDVIPILYEGKVDVDFIKGLLSTMSYLGGEEIEGVVIKNYNQIIEYYGLGLIPLFTKVVQEKFKERNVKTHTSKKVSIIEYLASFNNEVRWEKAIQKLRDDGTLENAPKDIGSLIREVQKDVLEEETENIKQFLFDNYKKHLIRVCIKGLPEWYKEKLLERIK